MSNRPTIADVAKTAGVSKSTVSRVLNDNRQYMRPETRERVLEAIKELGFRPNNAARSLISKRTNTFGLLVSDISNPYYPEIIMAVEHAAQTRGYNVFLCNTNYDIERGMAFIRSLIDHRADGVVIMSSNYSEEWLLELTQNDIPVVVVDWEVQTEGRKFAAIRVNFSSGIHKAVEHLIELGHRRFAHVSGPLELQTSCDRRDTFIEALSGYGVSSQDVAIVEGNLAINGGRLALEKLLALPVPPTAIFAANDLTAIGLLNSAHKLNLRIPENLSIVGLDDIWLAAETEPPLTTVAIPSYQMGHQVVKLLFDLIQSDDIQASTIYAEVQTELVIRNSTAPCHNEVPK